MKKFNKWDSRFIELAKYVSEWSKDPKAKVGAVVVVDRIGAIALGFNGFPIGVEDTAKRLSDQETKLELIVHAEQNALINAGSKSDGAIIFVWGKPICSHCAGSIIQAGIWRVVAFDPQSVSKNSKWYKTGIHSIEMFEEVGIECDFFTP